MKYEIDSKTYKLLYARYLDEAKTAELLAFAGPLKGKRVLDLCCGGGRLTKAVLKRKPKQIIAVDESIEMLPKDNVGYLPGQDVRFARVGMPWDIKRYNCGTVYEALFNLEPESIDVIFCQQAINYWFDPRYVPLIKKILAPGGKFLFNTFNHKPSEIPRVKNYWLRGISYTEVSWLIGDMVKHIQIAEGMEPHLTEFKWIPPHKFKKPFEKRGLISNALDSDYTTIYLITKQG